MQNSVERLKNIFYPKEISQKTKQNKTTEITQKDIVDNQGGQIRNGTSRDLRFSDGKLVVLSRRIKIHICFDNIQPQIFKCVHLK